MGSRTEQVLLVISLKARIARFGWGADSGSMESLYFDQTIRPGASSFWFLAGGTPTVLQHRQRRRHDCVVPSFGSLLICRLVYGSEKFLQSPKVGMGPAIRRVRCRRVSYRPRGENISAQTTYCL